MLVKGLLVFVRSLRKLNTLCLITVNGVVQNSTEKSRGSLTRDSNPPSKARSFDNGKNNRPNNQDQKDGIIKKFTNHTGDDKAEGKRFNVEKTNNRFTSEGRTSLSNPREKETKPVNFESVNHDRPKQGFNQADEDRHNSRTERSDRTEKLLSRTMVSKLTEMEMSTL